VREAAVRGHSGSAAVLHSFHLAYLVGGAVALLGVAGAAMSRSTERDRVPTVEALEALDVTERQPVLLREPGRNGDIGPEPDADPDPNEAQEPLSI